jgi:hypothetical protein
MKIYKGSCHCGAVQFQIESDLAHSVICDCSLCSRRGATMVRCSESALLILEGEEFLQKYQFNTMTAEHYFCKVCGIYTFHRMRKLPDMFGVNAGCLEGVMPHELNPVLTEGSKR